MHTKARFRIAICLLDNAGRELHGKANFVVRGNFKAKSAMSANVHEDVTLSIMGTLVIAWAMRPPQSHGKDVTRSLA